MNTEDPPGAGGTGVPHRIPVGFRRREGPEAKSGYAPGCRCNTAEVSGPAPFRFRVFRGTVRMRRSGDDAGGVAPGRSGFRNPGRVRIRDGGGTVSAAAASPHRGAPHVSRTVAASRSSSAGMRSSVRTEGPPCRGLIAGQDRSSRQQQDAQQRMEQAFSHRSVRNPSQR